MALRKSFCVIALGFCIIALRHRCGVTVEAREHFLSRLKFELDDFLTMRTAMGRRCIPGRPPATAVV